MLRQGSGNLANVLRTGSATLMPSGQQSHLVAACACCQHDARSYTGPLALSFVFPTHIYVA